VVRSTLSASSGRQTYGLTAQLVGTSRAGRRRWLRLVPGRTRGLQFLRVRLNWWAVSAYSAASATHVRPSNQVAGGLAYSSRHSSRYGADVVGGPSTRTGVGHWSRRCGWRPRPATSRVPGHAQGVESAGCAPGDQVGQDSPVDQGARTGPTAGDVAQFGGLKS